MCADLVLLGAGHANLPLISRIPDIIGRGHRVTCISLSESHYYSGMGPGMLGGSYTPEQIRFPVSAMVQAAGGTFMTGRATRIDADNRTVTLDDGRLVPYDVLSVNTGSTIAPTVTIAPGTGTDFPPRVFRAKPIGELLELRAAVRESLGGAGARIAVVGGGPAAVEIAGNLVRVAREAAGDPLAGAEAPFGDRVSVQLIAGREVLPGFPSAAERCVTGALEALGVKLRLSQRVDRITGNGMEIDGTSEPVDIVVLATGVVPSRLFADSRLPLGVDGSLAVNEYLHALGHHEIFGGGDCIWFTPRMLARAGVFAVRQGPVLAHNVVATLDSGTAASLKRFSPGGAYLLLLNLGDDTAVLWRRVLGFHVVNRSKSAYRLKDRIDMAFMHRFGSESDRLRQTSGGPDPA